jgi:hypothetical protein
LLLDTLAHEADVVHEVVVVLIWVAFLQDGQHICQQGLQQQTPHRLLRNKKHAVSG